MEQDHHDDNEPNVRQWQKRLLECAVRLRVVPTESRHHEAMQGRKEADQLQSGIDLSDSLERYALERADRLTELINTTDQGKMPSWFISEAADRISSEYLAQLLREWRQDESQRLPHLIAASEILKETAGQLSESDLWDFCQSEVAVEVLLADYLDRNIGI